MNLEALNSRLTQLKSIRDQVQGQLHSLTGQVFEIENMIKTFFTPAEQPSSGVESHGETHDQSAE